MSDRAALLDGIDDDLVPAAERVLDGCDLMAEELRGRFSMALDCFLVMDSRDRLMGVFRRFSGHDVAGMVELIATLHRALAGFAEAENEDPAPQADLVQARDVVEGTWSGAGAYAASNTLLELQGSFQTAAHAMCRLLGAALAAREAIVMGRDDLKKLAESFHTAAEEFRVGEGGSDGPNMFVVLGTLFVGAAVGMVTAGLGTGLAAGAVIGALEVTSGAAGSILAAEITPAPSNAPAGNSAGEIIDSFLAEADRISASVVAAAEGVAEKLRGATAELEHRRADIPPPPDVSPGPVFDPSDFWASEVSDDLADLVRDLETDVEVSEPDGMGNGGSEISARLAGEEPAAS
ncbi:hypothetical protein [Saccharopolyspora hordei]|uniref:Uncharacterized protein n=1 Tax=Saccharopolyspora hordei TaxID=1838 RepID=A0A853ADP0_9PSEU|nr:hypothetical protein [Saccharopolyspora hordei]NYI82594.1 hypothetical protein [Saccharopolyspora hordei]